MPAIKVIAIVLLLLALLCIVMLVVIVVAAVFAVAVVMVIRVSSVGVAVDETSHVCGVSGLLVEIMVFAGIGDGGVGGEISVMEIRVVVA